jgi:hypothetical protein
MILDKNVKLSSKLIMLSVYKKYVLKEPTEKQLNKFYSSLEKTRDDLPSIESKERTTRSAQGLWKKYFKPSCVKKRNRFSYFRHAFSHNKSLPDLGRDMNLSGEQSAKEDELHVDLIQSLLSEPIRELVARGMVDDQFSDPKEHAFLSWFMRMLEDGIADSEFNQYGELLHTVLGTKKVPVRIAEYFRKSNLVGSINYIQEPGCKLRAVANPLRLGQWYLDPLKDLLLEFLKNFPSDCTHEQSKGVRIIKKQLSQGKTAHCYDLSDATNNLPFLHLKHCLDATVRDLAYDITFDEDIPTGTWIDSALHLFYSMAKADWLTPENRIVKFTQGQPLGLGPSFPCLAFQHHVILHECGASQDDYVLLGDDIVIFRSDVASRYEQAMRHYGVPISISKSIISDTIAEFAGKVITSKSVYSMYSWKEINSTNCMDVLKYHGSKSVTWLPEVFQLPAWHIASLPRYLGGLGWNIPKHIKLDDGVIKELRERALSEQNMVYRSSYLRIQNIIMNCFCVVPWRERQIYDNLSYLVDQNVQNYSVYSSLPHYVVGPEYPKGVSKRAYVISDRSKTTNKPSHAALMRIALKRL